MVRRVLLAGVAATLVITFAGATASIAGASGTTGAPPGLPHTPAQIRQALTHAGVPLGTSAGNLDQQGASTGGSGPAVITPAQWSELMTPTFGAGSQQMLRSVSCGSPSGCVAVGSAYTSTSVTAIAAVLSGGQWTATPVPAPTGGTSSSLSSVSCAGPSFCIAVGAQFPFSTTTPPSFTPIVGATGSIPLIEQWNGTSWSAVPNSTHTYTTEFLTSVSCPSTDSCVAVGTSFTLTALSVTTVVYRWDGTTWTNTRLPATFGTVRLAEGVSCTSPTFCMTTGLALAISGTPTTATSTTSLIEIGTFALRWDGSTWSTASPATTPTAIGLSLAVSCASPSMCTAVGISFSVTPTTSTTPTGLVSGLIQQWNGSVWSTTPTPSAGPAELTGVDCFGPTSCVATGLQAPPTVTITGTGTGTGTGMGPVPLVESWNGAAWAVTSLPTVTPNGTPTTPTIPLLMGLFGVSCVPNAQCVTVGANIPTALSFVSPVPRPGYNEVASDGGLFAFGTAPFYGSMGGKTLNAPVVGMAMSPDGGGYWEVASDGGIFAFGDAAFYGSMGGKPLNAPVVGMAATPDGRGYYEVASDGGIFAFGDAAFHGSMGGKHLNAPIVGMAEAPGGAGYYEVASDGGIFAFGTGAEFQGSMGGKTLNKPVVGMATTPSGHGYWEVASDGGIFAFGDAVFYGSMGGQPLNAPVVGIATTPSGHGYWEVASDGGIFAFGDAPFLGSMGGKPLNKPMVGMAQ